MAGTKSFPGGYRRPFVAVAVGMALLVQTLGATTPALAAPASSLPSAPAASLPAGEVSRPGNLTIAEGLPMPRATASKTTSRSEALTDGGPARAAATTPPQATDGPRVNFGCSGNGTDGKRIQVMYVTPAGSPDRYPSQAAVVRQQLMETDTVFAESAQKNGGSSRQVRWVHDASCQPVIQRVTIPSIVDSTGGTRRVDGQVNDTINTMAAAGYKMDDWNRKYLLFVDYTAKPTAWEDPICGVTTGVSNDSQADLSNSNNQGRTVSRVDTQCWQDQSEDYILPAHSVAAHELAHSLGAVLPGSPNGTASGHCTDNADLMCLGVPTGYDPQGYPTGYDATMRSVCPAAQENLLDCNGDDYFSTSTAPWVSGQWLSPASATPSAGHWNVANSSFLYTPAAPTVTLRAGDGFDPGVPVPLTAAITVPSGQGWHVDYAIIQAIGTAANGSNPAVPASCSLTRSTALSTDPAAAGTSLLCNVGTTSASVKATVTSEDGQSGVHILKLTPGNSLRLATTNLTTSSNPVRTGAPVTLSARMTDDRTGLPVFGHQVHFLSRDGDFEQELPDALTDFTGTARITLTAEASTRYVAVTDWSHAWASTEAVLDVAVSDPTALTLTATRSYADPGAEVTLTGRLTTDVDEPLLFRSIELWRYADGSWTQLDTISTDQYGVAEAEVAVTTDASYQLRFAGIGSYARADSPAVSIGVRRATTTSATLDQIVVNTGGTITVTGTVTAAIGPVAGLPVGLWLHSGNAWTKVSSAATSVDGKVAFITTPASSGSYQLRFAASERLLASTTTDLPFSVRTALTLTATIPTSAPYGSPLTISAVVRTSDGPLAGRSVQLWRVGRTGDILVTIAAATSADGTARFQVPADGNHTYQARVPADSQYEAAVSAQTATFAVRSTALTVTITDTTVSYGDTLAITATLMSTSSGAPGPLVGAGVELWATPSNATASRVAAAETSPTGAVAFTVTPVATSTYQVRFGGTNDAFSSVADLGTVTVTRTANSTLSMPSTANYGASTMLTGTVTWSGGGTAVTSAAVELWSAVDGRTFTKTSNKVTDAAGQASFSVTPTATATYQLRHTGGGDGPWQLVPAQPTFGQTLTVIRATEAIVSAPREVAYNAKATVTGTLRWSGATTGVASQPVQLWALPTGQSWTKVATATTSATGQVSFPITANSTTTYQLRYPGGPAAGPVTAAAATSSTAAVTAVRATSATIKLSTTRLTYGSKVTVTSTLQWAGTSIGVASHPVELWGNARGSWTRVGSATTSSAGATTFAVTPSFTTTYQLRSAARIVGPVTAQATTSNSLTTRVVAKVSLTAPSRASSRSSVTVTGTVTPAISGRTVSIVVNGRTLTKVTTSSTGKFTAKVKLPKGRPSIYASVPTTTDNDGARSSTRAVRTS